MTLIAFSGLVTEVAAKAITFEPAPPGGVPYFLYMPEKLQEDQHPLVLVHGISRNAEEHIKAFLPLAQQQGRILIAPFFDKKQGKGYQRVRSRQIRADKMLDAVLSDVRERFCSSAKQPFTKVDLFGFSGGAQFSHRYAMFYPERVAHLIVASAGWYTFPDHEAAYPYGISRQNSRGKRLQKKLGAFLGVPTLVLVGARDNRRDASLRKNQLVDQQQGRNRLERAVNWVGALEKQAVARGVVSQVDLRIMPKCAHDFGKCVQRAGLVELVREWLLSVPFDSASTPLSTSAMGTDCACGLSETGASEFPSAPLRERIVPAG